MVLLSIVLALGITGPEVTNLSPTAAVETAARADEFADVRLRNLGIACGHVASIRYCFPLELLMGPYAPTNEEVVQQPEFLKIDSSGFDLYVPYDSSLKNDCYDKVTHKQIEFSLRIAPKDDTLDAYADRDFQNTLKIVGKALRPDALTGLRCAQTSSYPEGLWCLKGEKAPSAGGMIMRCDSLGRVPSPHCVQTYYQAGLIITTQNLQQCGIHWRKILDLVDGLLKTGQTTADKIDNGEM
jgi:hypothetical protein